MSLATKAVRELDKSKSKAGNKKCAALSELMRVVKGAKFHKKDPFAEWIVEIGTELVSTGAEIFERIECNWSKRGADAGGHGSTEKADAENLHCINTTLKALLVGL